MGMRTLLVVAGDAFFPRPCSDHLAVLGQLARVPVEERRLVARQIDRVPPRPTANRGDIEPGDGQIIGQHAFDTDRRVRYPAANTHEVKCRSNAIDSSRPGSSGRGSAIDSRCAPFIPAPATRPTEPSGA